jgi:hypothetical protein
VARVHEVLGRGGLRLEAAAGQPEVLSECTRVARLLREGRERMIGLVPASEVVAVPAVALQLGLGLAEIAGAPVAVVDAHGSWPGAAELASAGKVEASLFACSWMAENLAFLTPRTFDFGALVLKLGAALYAEAQIFAHLLIDLTGFAQHGEEQAAMAMLDGVIVVAREGVSTRPELVRWMRAVPAGRNLGVLLVGA